MAKREIAEKASRIRRGISEIGDGGLVDFFESIERDLNYLKNKNDLRLSRDEFRILDRIELKIKSIESNLMEDEIPF